MNDTWEPVRCKIKFIIYTINNKRIPQAEGLRFSLGEATAKQGWVAWAFLDLVGAWGGVEWWDLNAGWDLCGLNFPSVSRERAFGFLWTCSLLSNFPSVI